MHCTHGNSRGFKGNRDGENSYSLCSQRWVKSKTHQEWLAICALPTLSKTGHAEENTVVKPEAKAVSKPVKWCACPCLCRKWHVVDRCYTGSFLYIAYQWHSSQSPARDSKILTRQKKAARVKIGVAMRSPLTRLFLPSGVDWTISLQKTLKS